MTIHRRAIDIAKDIQFRGQGGALLRDDWTPAQFVEQLAEHQQYNDAIRFLAHALPKRLAVWWGCLCLWQANRPAPDPILAAVLEAAVRWVRDPSEAHRRAAEGPGRAATLDAPAGCLGLAVFWSGGSMGKPEWPAVPPPPLLTAQCVSGAVLLAAALSGAVARRTQLRREFIALGQQVATGAALWRTPPPQPWVAEVETHALLELAASS